MKMEKIIYGKDGRPKAVVGAGSEEIARSILEEEELAWVGIELDREREETMTKFPLHGITRLNWLFDIEEKKKQDERGDAIWYLYIKCYKGKEKKTAIVPARYYTQHTNIASQEELWISNWFMEMLDKKGSLKDTAISWYEYSERKSKVYLEWSNSAQGYKILNFIPKEVFGKLAGKGRGLWKKHKDEFHLTEKGRKELERYTSVGRV